jgi:hypothetical protein
MIARTDRVARGIEEGAMQHLRTISRTPKPAQLDIATQLEIKVNTKVATIERKAAQIR